jgi:endonuclease G, mitochondrial
MAYRNSFWRRYFGSAVVFAIAIGLIYILNNDGLVSSFFAKIGINKAEDIAIAQKKIREESYFPDTIIPQPEMAGQWIYKPNFMLYYDEDIMQARFTLHKLDGASTRGEANRYGIRFEEEEVLSAETARYSDYSGSGYDRGHLVPAGDFKCCQTDMIETFSMSNIAPFDSVLNRHAWNELEIKTRKWARRFGSVYVITGPVFEHRFHYIGRYADVSVPTHFFKIVFTISENTGIPKYVIAFLLPNEPIYTFSQEKSTVNLDRIEEMTDLDFFKMLPDDLENKLEAANQTGVW